MNIVGISHQYGPWTPMQFVITPDPRPTATPTLFISTSRMCRGLHDWRCTTVETQTYGPFTLEGTTYADLWTCPGCSRRQPVATPTVPGALCLRCTNGGTSEHTYDSTDASVGLAAGAALNASLTLLRRCADADPDGYLALLEGTGELLEHLITVSADAIKDDSSRARQSLYGAVTLIARQITANARQLASLPTED